MIFGLFGLSGVGKTMISSKVDDEDDRLVSVSASEIIKSYGYNTRFDELKDDLVRKNQFALIEGFKEFKNKNTGKDVVIELHNLIETPEGNIDIDEVFLAQLELDGACFIELEPFRIRRQRIKDVSRSRYIKSGDELCRLQTHSKHKFQKFCLDWSVPNVILSKEHLSGLQAFIGSARMRKEG
jgi:adenylate kinase